MTDTTQKPTLTFQSWLVIIIASIGFLFDTYQLLMTPLAGPQAIAELLKVPLSNPAVTATMPKLLWMTALCGGIFGLLGGWLIDRLGRKFVMALGIFIYSLSPVAGAYAHTLNEFIFWRCVTFVGVCIEFVAAITWIAEIFVDKVQKERWLGITQAFASLGGVTVSWINLWIIAHAKDLGHWGLPIAAGGADPSSWRYLMLSGVLPALPIALMLPFVPESQIWRQKKMAGTLKRPSFGELFSPQLRRVTLVTAGLSACAYGVAFGCLQLTPGRIAPGLPNLAEEQKALKPLGAQSKQLNEDLDALTKGDKEKQVLPFADRVAKVPGLAKLVAERGGVRIAQREQAKIANAVPAPDADEATKAKIEAAKPAAKEKLAALVSHFKELDAQFTQMTADAPDAKAAVVAREKIMKALGDNRDAQDPYTRKVKEAGSIAQSYQETGGLVGRIVLALLIIVGIGRRLLLRLLQVPGLVILPLTYLTLYKQDASVFYWGMAAAGFVTTAQFSFLGEYMPKMFPLHLRGTGGSFATNVGGRMIGTSAAFLTSNVVSPLFKATHPNPYDQLALAAGWVGLSIVILSVIFGCFLPEPKGENLD
jgi:MFS family permease